MKYVVKRLVITSAIALSSLSAYGTSAQAYQVDCAILLCLAGGWPASAPCTHARAVFIQRITPWPIEPPLQIWRCPMGVSFNAPTLRSPMERLYDSAFPGKPSPHFSVDPFTLVPTGAVKQSDIDISGEAFNFVRSIRVFHIQYQQSETENVGCRIRDQTRLGEYGIQGDFDWHSSSASRIPKVGSFDIPSDCKSYFYRGVVVDWRDHEGNYGFEEVRY